MTNFFTNIYQLLKEEWVPLLILLCIATGAWLVIKMLFKIHTASWPLILALTWISGLTAAIVAIRLEPRTALSASLIFFPVVLVGVALLAFAYIKTSGKVQQLLSGFLPVAVPLTYVFHYFLFLGSEWTVEVADSNYGTSLIHTCMGFPLPCYGTFYQFNTGEAEVNLTYFIVDNLIYLLLAYLTYYVLKKLINFKKLLPKTIAIIFCILPYLFSLSCCFYFIDGTHPWPQHIKYLGLHFHFPYH